MNYSYASGNGVYINDYTSGGYGYGYYYHYHSYTNTNYGTYSHEAMTDTSYGDMVYRHDVWTQHSDVYAETKYQNQYIQGYRDYMPDSHAYEVYTGGATAHTYVNLQNYAEGWTETTHTYGYGQSYGEQIYGFTSYDGPVKGYYTGSYTTYMYGSYLR